MRQLSPWLAWPGNTNALDFCSGKPRVSVIISFLAYIHVFPQSFSEMKTLSHLQSDSQLRAGWKRDKTLV